MLSNPSALVYNSAVAGTETGDVCTRPEVGRMIGTAGSHRHGVGITRRELLQVGYSGLLGIGLSQVLQCRRAAAAAPATDTASPKSVILIFLGGAPSHIDTFDMKPAAPDGIRGEFRPIATRVPGLQFCEHLPRLANIADRLTVVRSMTHNIREHFPATHMVLTGNNTTGAANPEANLSRSNWPCYAAGVNFVRPRRDGIPNGVTIPYPLTEQNLVWPGQHAGFLGPRFDPWFLHEDPERPQFKVAELELRGINIEQLGERRVLLNQLNRQRSEIARIAEREGLASQQNQAFDMLTSGRIATAFSVDRESERVRQRYGRHIFGQTLLLARRLIEVGVPVVQANMGVAQTWDTHRHNFPRLKNDLLPPLDASVSALIGDLAERGLLSKTLVVMLGEFGRTPRIGTMVTAGSSPTGRDHWGGVFFSVFAGGGVHAGKVIGRSDKIAAYPVTKGYYPADLGATIYDALGVNRETELHDALGRPLQLNRGTVMQCLYSGAVE